MAVTTEYGMQVDAWGALVMDRANLAEELEKLTIQNLKERELEKVTITKTEVRLGGTALEHVVVEQDLGGGGRATTLLRIVPRAKDLDLSWRLFERNLKKMMVWGMSQHSLITAGIGFIIAGLFTAIFGFGLCFVPVGIVLLGVGLGWWTVGRKKTTAGTTEQFASRALANTVHWALMKALASKGIASQHLQVLQPATEPGLGKLMPTDMIDELAGTSKLSL